MLFWLSVPFPNSVVKVEALACCRAVKFAFEIGIHEVIFKGDSMIVIQALNHKSASEAPYGNLIDDILTHVSHLSYFELCHVKCSCNRVANALAKKAKFGLEFQA